MLWGESGKDQLLANFSSAAQRAAYGVDVGSAEGWENLCSTREMDLFITSSGGDVDHCSYSKPGAFLSGCAAGFFQPRDDDGFYDSRILPRACPEGFFCPLDFACTVACVPGSQCYNSTFGTDGRCFYPKTMAGSKKVDPLPVVRDDGPQMPSLQPAHAPANPSLEKLAMAAAASGRPTPPTLARGHLAVVAPGSSDKIPVLAASEYAGSYVGRRPRVLDTAVDSEDEVLLCPGADNMYLCAGGHWCPTSILSFECTVGKYCPQGSIGMTPCASIATCHHKAVYPNYSEQVIDSMALVIVVLVGCLRVFGKVRNHLREKRRAARHAAQKLAAQQTRASSADVDRRGRPRANTQDSVTPPTSPEGCASVAGLTPGSLNSLRDKRETRMELSFVRLGLVLRSNDFKVLNGVTGRCRPGRVTAIMGPSGAGKTTLMNTLAGRATYGRSFGSLLINGLVDSIHSYSDLVGFVPQDDIMHCDLSVKENLSMYAALRLPASMSRGARWAVIQDVLKVLELERIQHSIIGDAEKRGISGGQRKRVNIGMEMVADPSLLFLDEPTSGLDSTTSFAVIGALKSLALKGTNVIAVLHQPSYQIFEMFDDVIFLARGGFSVYVGPATGALDYFTRTGFTCPPLVNPADFFMDVIAGKYPREGHDEFSAEDLIGLWEEQEKELALAAHQRSRNLQGVRGAENGALKPLSPAILASIRPAGFMRSLAFFTARAVTQQLRASQQLVADFLLEAFAGVLVGCLYVHVEFVDLTKFMSFMALALGLTISIASLRVFGNERVVFWREAAPGSGMRLDKFAYFIAKNLVELPRLAVLTFFFVMSFYPTVTPDVPWTYFLAYSCAASFSVSGVAYLASIALEPLKAQLVVVIYVLVAVMFSGLATKLSVLNDNPLFLAVSYLSFARWHAELIYLQTVWSLTVAWRMPPAYYIKASKYSALLGLMELGYSPQDLVMYLDVGMLLLLGFIFRVLAFWSLVVCNRDKRGLPTIGQMSLYWIVNPLDDWARARKQRAEEERRRESFIALDSGLGSELAQQYAPPTESFLGNSIETI